MHFSFGGLMNSEFAGGRSYSCEGGLGARLSDTLPHFLPNVRALRLPAVQVCVWLLLDSEARGWREGKGGKGGCKQVSADSVAPAMRRAALL